MIGVNPPHALLRPRLAIPFLLVALIWGSTWLVIKGQLDVAPPSWSVTWRFTLATIGMGVLVLFKARDFRMTPGGHLAAIVIGLTQFFLNFNFVYRAEIYLTSGLVAVLFGLLMLPNSIFARIFLGQKITPRFLLGTIIGLAGIVLLLTHEARMAQSVDHVLPGIIFAGLGLLSASTANVMQAAPIAAKRPLVVLLFWAMLWGTLADFIMAWVTAGPPVFPASWEYWAGIAYLAIFGSVVTFPLYFFLIREIGAGRAAYNGVIVPIVAMVLSTVFEAYQWSLLALLGAVLALLGMVVALRAKHIPPKSRFQD
ncbi:EamA family transporter [Altericroceibacterium spongiae]|uniref:EamA family transporter n=1 Tax=Altericroceibacterium spongiae TaxID=2320269 RepID=A0A420EIZ2_9SPHN|nr:DMT family transporter [Altericroceibacterium spongiae]RKF20526.1 EamA family transporter [Altericroceibacterium spongiae]